MTKPPRSKVAPYASLLPLFGTVDCQFREKCEKKATFVARSNYENPIERFLCSEHALTLRTRTIQVLPKGR